MADHKEKDGKANAASDAKLAKLKALQTTIEKLDKTYGKGTVMKLSDNKVSDVPAIHWPGHCPGHRGCAARTDCRNIRS
jgi:glyoxylase-like metal-dependent hydrolase (beta-lactamase superfamily II)